MGVGTIVSAWVGDGGASGAASGAWGAVRELDRDRGRERERREFALEREQTVGVGGAGINTLVEAIMYVRNIHLRT